MYGVVLQVVAFGTMLAGQLIAITQGQANLDRKRDEALRKFDEENGY